jgi:hypothetical protein
MGLLSKIGKSIKNTFKKTFKRIKKVLSPIGKALKKGLGKVGEFFGKLGPLGTLALSLMLPGLGTLWTSFGGWASSLSGPLGAVMQGVASAGNTVGRVYNSVSGMISDTVGTIARNTIGRVPVGGGKNLTDIYNGFSQWVGTKMDNLRMKTGLPTKNITPDSAIEDASKLSNEIQTLTTEDIANERLQAFMPEIEESLLTRNLETSSNFVGSTQSSPKIVDVELKGQPNVTKVITGFEKTPNQIGKVNIETLKPSYTEVPTGLLSEDQLALNNRLENYSLSLEKRADKIMESALIKNEAGDNIINPDFNQKDLLIADAKDFTDVGSKFLGVQEVFTGEDEELTASYNVVPYSQLEFQTDINTANDYTRAYTPAFTNAGYQGPMTFEGFANAGYYGGDPFSFGQYLQQRQIGSPMPTVTI